MSDVIHPSPDQLNAFFDHELESEPLAQINRHLPDCSQCQGVLADYAQLQDLGPAVLARLPGDGYWLDLPDRIQARITLEESRAGFFDRWKHRQWVFPIPMWQAGAALGATAVLAVVAWTTLQGPVNRSTSAPQDVAGNVEPAEGAFSPLEAADPDDGLGDVNPQAFTQRVVTTLGNRGNLGTSLDLAPGQPIDHRAGASDIGTPVGMSLAPTEPENQMDANRVLSYGCGVAPLEDAFLAALRAEEEGNLPLAQSGYRIIRRDMDQRHPLYWEAEYRYLYTVWRQQLMTIPPSQRAKALDQLAGQAASWYQQWNASQLTRDCQKAYCFYRAFAKLAGEEFGGAPAPQVSTHINALAVCAK